MIFFRTLSHSTITDFGCTSTRLQAAVPVLQDRMGERLLWAVKNGDLEVVKEIVEKVRFKGSNLNLYLAEHDTRPLALVIGVHCRCLQGPLLDFLHPKADSLYLLLRHKFRLTHRSSHCMLQAKT